MGRATGCAETSGGLRGAPLGRAAALRWRRIRPPRIAATAQSPGDTASSLQRTPQSVLLLEAEDAAEPPLERSGQGERIVERIDGIALERRPERRLEPVRCGLIAHDLLDRGIREDVVHRAGSSRLGSAVFEVLSVLRSGEVRSETDGRGSPLWIELAIAPRTSSRHRSRSLRSAIRRAAHSSAARTLRNVER